MPLPTQQLKEGNSPYNSMGPYYSQRGALTIYRRLVPYYRVGRVGTNGCPSYILVVALLFYGRLDPPDGWAVKDGYKSKLVSPCPGQPINQKGWPKIL